MGGPRLDPKTRVWRSGQWISPEADERRRIKIRARQNQRRRDGLAPDKRVYINGKRYSPSKLPPDSE